MASRRSLRPKSEGSKMEKNWSRARDRQRLDSEDAKTLGMTLSVLSDEQRKKFSIDADIKGVVVTEVEPDGPAAEKRIAPGDVITEAGRKPVASPADIPAQVKDARNAEQEFNSSLYRQGGQAERHAVYRRQGQVARELVATIALEIE